MSESTRLLVQWCWVRVFAAGLFVSLVSVLISLISPLETGSLLWIPVIGMALTLLTGLHPLLANTMFPVTHRQLAWIPLAAWGAMTLAGIAAVLLIHLLWLALERVSAQEIWIYWFAAVPVCAPVVFILFLLWRGLLYYPGIWRLAIMAPLFSRQLSMPPWILDWYWAAWPLLLGGCVFLVWEAPRQIAAIRRVDYTDGGVFNTLNIRDPQLGSPVRPAWQTSVANSIVGLFLLILIAAIVSELVRLPSESFQKDPFNFIWFSYLIPPVVFFVHCWRNNRASRMSRSRSLAVLLVEITLVGYPFREHLGVKRGSVVRCGFCRDWRLVWQSRCPHCGDGHVHNVPEKQAMQAADWLVHDQLTMAYRLIIPCFVSAFILINNWQRWFGQ